MIFMEFHQTAKVAIQGHNKEPTSQQQATNLLEIIKVKG